MIKIELKYEIPERLHEDVIKNLYWIDKGISNIFINKEDNKTLFFDYNGSNSVNEIIQNLRESINKILKSYNKVPTKIFFSNHIECLTYKDDPYKMLVDAGSIVVSAKGVHVYKGLMSKLFNGLSKKFKQVALEFTNKDYKFPTLISVENLIKAGYLESYAHNTNLVIHFPEQPDVIDYFKKGINKTNYDLENFQINFSKPDVALSPTVCHHYYYSIENTVLENDITILTAESPCYRYESHATSSLKRLREFNMREIIAVGKPEKVVEFRNKLLEVMKLMIEYSCLKSNIQTASDAFFVDVYDKQRLYQLSFDLKYEAETYLPFDNSWFSIGSVNYHQDHMGKAFNIKTNDNKIAHSCCLGFGIDRWCFAIFAQYGTDINSWPSNIQKLISDED